jgi:hypothetical protein
MITILVLVLLFIILDMAAMRWGATTSEGAESKEWEHRQTVEVNC